jgi:hypothetical protein
MKDRIFAVTMFVNCVVFFVIASLVGVLWMRVEQEVQQQAIVDDYQNKALNIMAEVMEKEVLPYVRAKRLNSPRLNPGNPGTAEGNGHVRQKEGAVGLLCP